MNSPEKDEIVSVSGSSRNGKLRAFVTGLTGLALCALALWIHSVPPEILNQNAAARLQAHLGLASDNATNVIVGLRNYLGLLSRMPELRKTSSVSRPVEYLQNLHDDIELLLESFEQPLAIIYQEYLRYYERFSLMSELPMAFYRRIGSELSINHLEDDDEESAGEVYEIAVDELLKKTLFSRDLIASARAYIQKQFLNFNRFSSLMNILPFLQKTVALDVTDVENLFAVAMHEELLRALMIKDLNGVPFAKYGDGISEKIVNDDRDCRAIKNGAIFYCGPVAFDSQANAPVWWVALPVRNARRETVSCLSAVIDLSFLSEISGKSAESGVELFFVESGGSLIGSADESLLQEMVNMRSMMLRTDKWENQPEAYVSIRSGPEKYYLGGGSLNREAWRHLPDWKLLGRVSISHFTSSGNYLFLLCVIVLAAAGVFALSCSLMRILNFSTGEE